MKFTIELDARELATVIAALKWWKDIGEPWDDLVDRASAGGTLSLMLDAEIDDLAERINAASAPKVSA